MTISGTFLKPDGTPNASLLVLFTPILPTMAGTGFVRAVPVGATTDDMGLLSIDLQPGHYLMEIPPNKRDARRVIVDDGNSSVDLSLLIAVSSPAGDHVADFYLPQRGNNFQIDNGYLRWLNPDTNLANTSWVPNDVGPQLALDPGVALLLPYGSAPRAGNNYRVDLLGNFQLKQSAGDDLWRSVNIVGLPTLEQFQYSNATLFEVVESAGLFPLAGLNYRLRRGFLQLLNLTQGGFQTINPVGADDMLTWQFKAIDS